MKNKIISNIFKGIALILYCTSIFIGFFIAGLLVSNLLSDNIYLFKVDCLILIINAIVIYPLNYLFLDLSDNFNPNPPRVEYIDRREPPYKDWY